jgi:hypothetical protein
MAKLKDVGEALSSPYLRSHADNPVEWWLFDDDAFDEARRRDLPVFLSVGYAACHWCHVMEKESFSDPTLAALLNENFISIKVDREERPDVDALYMSAAQAISGHGGWPLSVFTTSDGLPFFAGTYFPKTPHGQMPSFTQVLNALCDLWQNRRSEVLEQAHALSNAAASAVSPLTRLDIAKADPATSAQKLLRDAISALSDRFDAQLGGFSGAPKFPRPSYIELCLLSYRQNGDPHCGEMANTTLSAMAHGGIYDHIGGGIARYSTDRLWLVPHFEKMLSDQALCALSYLHAYQLFGDETFAQVARELLTFATTDLAHPSGGLCASLDADAGGIEGAHIVWTPDEVNDVLARADLGYLSAEVCSYYTISAEGNFEGTSIPLVDAQRSLLRSPAMESARRALRGARDTRVQPLRDDKVITEWNAMAVVALCEAAGSLTDDGFANHALAVMDALVKKNRRGDGRWWRTSNGPTLAFANDYAWLIRASLSLYSHFGTAKHLERAIELGDALLALFFDPESAAIYTGGNDAPGLFARGEELFDGATPAGTSVSFDALSRLGALSTQSRFSDAAQKIRIRTLSLLDQQILSAPDLVGALFADEYRREVVITGTRSDLVSLIQHAYLPEVVLAFGESAASDLFATRQEGLAYVCEHGSCQAPVTSAQELVQSLGLH